MLAVVPKKNAGAMATFGFLGPPPVVLKVQVTLSPAGMLPCNSHPPPTLPEAHQPGWKMLLKA